MRSILINSFFMIFLYGGITLAQGGPPLVTDDPGTPGDGHFEINLPQIRSDSKRLTQVIYPYFDIAYGIGERAQLRYQTGWVENKPKTGPAVHGATLGGLGVKYRFQDEADKQWAWSTYPAITYHQFFSSENSDLAANNQDFYLPVSAAKHFANHFAINPEIGFRFAPHPITSLELGIVLAYEEEETLELLSEVRTASRIFGNGTESLINIGFRYAFKKDFRLIGAIGHTASAFKGELTQLETFFGVQISL